MENPGGDGALLGVSSAEADGSCLGMPPSDVFAVLVGDSQGEEAAWELVREVQLALQRRPRSSAVQTAPNMADGVARVHGNKSNRASTTKPAEHKRVFKSVLSNPFEIRWPTVPLNVANSILAQAIALVDGVAEYHLHREAESRKRKRERRTISQSRGFSARSNKKVKRLGLRPEHSMDTEDPAVNAENPSKSVTLVTATTGNAASTIETGHQADTEDADAPPILEHILIGINEVTKKLEAQAKATRTAVVVSSDGAVPPTHQSIPDTPISVVLICRGDVDPPLLIAHLPPLVAACNSLRQPTGGIAALQRVKLIPLPKGAEAALTEALGLRRAAVIAFDREAPGIAMLSALLESVPTIAAPWLAPADPEPRRLIALAPTHIKQLRTSAPKDMKAAKEQRARGKADAKVRKQAKGTKRQKKVTISVTV